LAKLTAVRHLNLMLQSFCKSRIGDSFLLKEVDMVTVSSTVKVPRHSA